MNLLTILARVGKGRGEIPPFLWVLLIENVTKGLLGASG